MASSLFVRRRAILVGIVATCDETSASGLFAAISTARDLKSMECSAQERIIVIGQCRPQRRGGESSGGILRSAES